MLNVNDRLSWPPLRALDGSRAVWKFLNSVRGRRIKAKQVQPLSTPRTGSGATGKTRRSEKYQAKRYMWDKSVFSARIDRFKVMLDTDTKNVWSDHRTLKSLALVLL